MATKIPKKFRITFQAQGDYRHPGVKAVPLGFAIVYAPGTQVYERQKANQDEWAYGQYHNEAHEIDGVMYTRPRQWKVTSDPMTEMVAVLPSLQPIIIDNEPLEGYQIQHMVSRHRGNKLWRILHPLGFELEITSGNFEDLVMSGKVDRGLILGPCVWRTGKMLERA